jgi:Ferritin-like
MRSRISRHLTQVLRQQPASAGPQAARPAGVEPPRPPLPPPELSGRDYAIFLLRLAAEVEHGLMVQYLFAAYSLEGRNGPAQADVRAWQETILGIAKEEMGHLVTVQNLLTALSAPLNFNREEFPHDTVLYPFGFRLQRVSLGSLATYICAESPAQWDDAEAREIKALAQVDAGTPVNRVGTLYAEVLRVLGDPALVADRDFDPRTVAFQASWDEWGRGYREGQRGAEAMSGLAQLPAPELLIREVGSRAAALDAIEQVGEQGEGFEIPADDNASHFRRFLEIYRGMKALGAGATDVVRPLATNPTTDLEGPDIGGPDDPSTTTPIAHEQARLWAHLFNLRYRKLLVNLSHAFELSDDPGDRTTLSPRGALIHRTFSEMYNLRAIAGQLVVLPIDGAQAAGPRAGPPFQIPHTLMLPPDEGGRWRLHRDVLDASATMIEQLRDDGSAGGRAYLAALAQMDAIERGQIEQLIAGSARLPAATGAPAS